MRKRFDSVRSDQDQDRERTDQQLLVRRRNYRFRYLSLNWTSKKEGMCLDGSDYAVRHPSFMHHPKYAPPLLCSALLCHEPRHPALTKLVCCVVCGCQLSGLMHGADLESWVKALGNANQFVLQQDTKLTDLLVCSVRAVHCLVAGGLLYR